MNAMLEIDGLSVAIAGAQVLNDVALTAPKGRLPG